MNKQTSSRELYSHYFNEICAKNNFRPVTRRRFFDILTELEELGFVKIRVVSKKREISLLTLKNDKDISETFQNVLNAIILLQKK